MFDSLPQAFVPKLAGMTMAGSFSLRAGFSLDTRHPDDMLIDWDLKNHCRVTKAPPEIDVIRFSRPFRRTVYDEHGDKVEIVSGPGTPDWVPLQAISPFMEAAVTTTEDGGFRNHGGFDKTAIKNSIRDNLRAGRFLRGASTISMQLAKNIYLEREKNLSRKLQEAALTTYLEQTLTKDEILELYFNVVEFGPMIYGIGPAAAHYFDTSASDLSEAHLFFIERAGDQGLARVPSSLDEDHAQPQQDQRRAARRRGVRSHHLPAREVAARSSVDGHPAGPRDGRALDRAGRSVNRSQGPLRSAAKKSLRRRPHSCAKTPGVTSKRWFRRGSPPSA
jgi:hypothetical protein